MVSRSVIHSFHKHEKKNSLNDRIRMRMREGSVALPFLTPMHVLQMYMYHHLHLMERKSHEERKDVVEGDEDIFLNHSMSHSFCFTSQKTSFTP